MTFDSREVEAGDLFVAMPGTVADGHLSSSPGAFAAGARARCCRKPVDGPHVLVDDVAAALTDLAIAARARMSGRCIGVTGSVGKTSHQGSAVRRARALRQRQGPPLGQELQQSHRRAAQPRADAARHRVCRARNGHEPCRRDRRADPAGAAASRSSPPSPRRISSISGRSRRSPTPRPRFSKGWSRTASPSSPKTARTATGSCRRRARHAERIITFGSGEADCPRGPRRPRRKWRQPGHRAAARERADLHHRPARRPLGVQCARGAGRGRGGRRRPRRRRAGAGRHGRAEGPRRAAPASSSTAARPADRRKLQRQSGVDGGDAQEPGRRTRGERRIAVLGPMRELGEHRR